MGVLGGIGVDIDEAVSNGAGDAGVMVTVGSTCKITVAAGPAGF